MLLFTIFAAVALAGLTLWSVLRAVVESKLERVNAFLLFMHKGGMGDAFCQTGLMRALRAKHPGLRFIVVTRYPEFFAGLPEVARVIDLSRCPLMIAAAFHAMLRLLRLRRALDFVYRAQRQTPRAWLAANPDVRPHLVELAAWKLRLPADFSDVRGSVSFSDEERSLFGQKYAGLGEDFALVVPTGKTSYTPNKEWGFARFARVVELTPDIRWVQLGLTEHAALPGAHDLRGATGLRELLWLIGRARFVLCGEGLHNHLAGALGTPCFVVASGLLWPEFYAYPTSVPIASPTTPSCAPCLLKTPCPVPGRPCLGEITPERVVAFIRAQ